MRRFEISDLETIQGWFVARGMHAPQAEDIPQIGFIEEATAAGFLLQAECGLAFIEHYISNPTASKEEREEALKKITHAIVNKAKSAGFKMLMFNTKIPSLKKLAFDSGFVYLGDYASFNGGLK